MRLEDIGFYTLSDDRVRNVNLKSPMWRCELILTERCNFKCPYCRGLRFDCRGEMDLNKVKEVIRLWTEEGLRNVRFSGGEPTLYPHLREVVQYTKERNVQRIAISTNGSAPFEYYRELVSLGVDDFSISLDACCSSMGEKMLGGIEGMWGRVVKNIELLSRLTYVTVGVVLTNENVEETKDIIRFAHSLGVADIRIISAAQFNQIIDGLSKLNGDILNCHPILKYRVNNFLDGRNVRGIKAEDFHQCGLVIDDSCVAGNFHFPCIIYLREGGNPIGKIGQNMREERWQWFKSHNSFEDVICRKNCLDVCIDYNNRYRSVEAEELVVYEGGVRVC